MPAAVGSPPAGGHRRRQRVGVGMRVAAAWPVAVAAGEAAEVVGLAAEGAVVAAVEIPGQGLA